VTRPFCLFPLIRKRATFAVPAGVAAMTERLVKGFVILAVMVMIVLAYAQRHEGCLRGRSLQTGQPCGSVGHDI
jgi:hypothetical protein